jgi:DNA-binding MarR family transcriptional regulator
MRDDDAGPAPWNVGLLLFVPYRAMESRVVEALWAAGFDDLTMAQARLAGRIAPQGSRLTELSEQARVTKQTAGFLVDQMEKHGYVRRVPDPTDGRARLVQLADRGLAAAEVATATVAQVEAEWTAHLGAARMRELRAALERLREITDIGTASAPIGRAHRPSRLPAEDMAR